MLRLVFSALLFWALLVAVVVIKQFAEVGAAVVEAPLPGWLWLPYTTAASFFDITLRPEDKATLYAGLGGTVLGGVISWAIARQTAADARATAKNNQLLSEKSNALKAVIKVAQLANGIYTIHRAIEGPIEAARAAGDYSIAIWPFLRPTTHTHSEVTFAADDLTPFTFAGKANIIQRMMELGTHYNTLSQAYGIYNRLRSDFQQFAEANTRFDILTGKHETIFEGEMKVRAQNKTFELDGLSRELRADSAKYHEHAKATCTLIDAFTQKRYADNGGFIKLDLVETASIADEPASA